MLWWVQNVKKWPPYWLETGLGWLTKTGNQAILLANKIQANKKFKIHKHHENSAYYHASNTYDNVYACILCALPALAQFHNAQTNKNPFLALFTFLIRRWEQLIIITVQDDFHFDGIWTVTNRRNEKFHSGWWWGWGYLDSRIDYSVWLLQQFCPTQASYCIKDSLSCVETN